MVTQTRRRGAAIRGPHATDTVPDPRPMWLLVVADANAVADAETGQRVVETCRLGGVQAVADGVVEKREIGVELARRDQGDQASRWHWWQAGWLIVGSAARELLAEVCG